MRRFFLDKMEIIKPDPFDYALKVKDPMHNFSDAVLEELISLDFLLQEKTLSKSRRKQITKLIEEKVSDFKRLYELLGCFYSPADEQWIARPLKVLGSIDGEGLGKEGIEKKDRKKFSYRKVLLKQQFIRAPVNKEKERDSLNKLETSPFFPLAKILWDLDINAVFSATLSVFSTALKEYGVGASFVGDIAEFDSLCQRDLNSLEGFDVTEMMELSDIPHNVFALLVNSLIGKKPSTFTLSSCKSVPENIDLSKILNFVLTKMLCTSSLKYLQLSNTELTFFMEHPLLKQFKGGPYIFMSLEELDLSGNKLETFPAGINFPNLKRLNLSSNKLRAFPKKAFFPNLKVLNLSHNQLGKCPKFLSKKKVLSSKGVIVPSLVALDLSHNQLERIRNLSHLKLEHFDTSGNENFRYKMQHLPRKSYGGLRPGDSLAPYSRENASSNLLAGIVEDASDESGSESEEEGEEAPAVPAEKSSLEEHKSPQLSEVADAKTESKSSKIIEGIFSKYVRSILGEAKTNLDPDVLRLIFEYDPLTCQHLHLLGISPDPLHSLDVKPNELNVLLTVYTKETYTSRGPETVTHNSIKLNFLSERYSDRRRTVYYETLEGGRVTEEVEEMMGINADQLLRLRQQVDETFGNINVYVSPDYIENEERLEGDIGNNMDRLSNHGLDELPRCLGDYFAKRMDFTRIKVLSIPHLFVPPYIAQRLNECVSPSMKRLELLVDAIPDSNLILQAPFADLEFFSLEVRNDVNPQTLLKEQEITGLGYEPRPILYIPIGERNCPKYENFKNMKGLHFKGGLFFKQTGNASFLRDLTSLHSLTISVETLENQLLRMEMNDEEKASGTITEMRNLILALPTRLTRFVLETNGEISTLGKKVLKLSTLKFALNKLRSLCETNLFSFATIDDDAMGYIYRGRTATSYLTKVDLSSQPLGDMGLGIFAQQNPFLRSINLSNTQVTEKGLEALRNACSNLQEIKVG